MPNQADLNTGSFCFTSGIGIDPTAVPARSITQYGYHVLDTSRNRRQIATTQLAHEDRTLTSTRRERIAENARDCERNFAVAAWAIRRHLDFVASFNFHCRADDPGLRRDVESYIADRERPENFDVAGIHSRRRWFRLFESRKVLDGDVFAVRLGNGQLQAVEAECCRQPGKKQSIDSRGTWNDGVLVSASGRPLAYAFHDQHAGAWSLERIVDAEKCWHHAHRTRFRQTRGVSEIVAGLATLLDTYETIDYSVARAKVEQMFALAITRQADDSMGPITEIATGGEDGDGNEQVRYEVDMGKGPIQLELEPGDDAKFLTTQSPSGQVQSFINELIGMSLKSLDIPRSFWDEAYATFHGSRSAALLYVKSCHERRQTLLAYLQDWTDWQLSRAFADGSLLQPSNMDLPPYVWHTTGVPWWNPSQEVAASVKALENRLTSRQRIVEETLGIDFFDLLDELASEEEQIRKRFPDEPMVTSGETAEYRRIG